MLRGGSLRPAKCYFMLARLVVTSSTLTKRSSRAQKWKTCK
jgi:hypothetical protein